MVHAAKTLKPPLSKLLLALASMLDLDVWSTDVKLVYVQSTEPLQRRVFVKSPYHEFSLGTNESFELLRSLYGLCDAGDLWHQTLDKHLTQDLEMVPNKADPSLYYSHEDDSLCGITGTYVDGMLRAGYKNFRKRCGGTHSKFRTSSDDEFPFTCSGSHVTRPTNSSLAIDQNFYLKQLEEFSTPSGFPEFRSMRMRLALLSVDI